MIQFIATCVLAFLTITKGVRHVIYTSTGTETEVNHPFPIDQCCPVHYNSTGDVLEVTYYVFSCENNGTDLEVYTFGDDSECGNGTNDNGTWVDSFNENDNVTVGDFGSFSCAGQDRYMVTMKFFGDDTCNETIEAPIMVYTATDVCYEDEYENRAAYTMVTCYADGGDVDSYQDFCNTTGHTIMTYNASCDFNGVEIFRNSTLNETYVQFDDCVPSNQTDSPSPAPVTYSPAILPTGDDMANSLQSFIACLVALFIAFAMAN